MPQNKSVHKRNEGLWDSKLKTFAKQRKLLKLRDKLQSGKKNICPPNKELISKVGEDHSSVARKQGSRGSYTNVSQDKTFGQPMHTTHKWKAKKKKKILASLTLKERCLKIMSPHTCLEKRENNVWRRCGEMGLVIPWWVDQEMKIKARHHKRYTHAMMCPSVWSQACQATSTVTHKYRQLWFIGRKEGKEQEEEREEAIKRYN